MTDDPLLWIGLGTMALASLMAIGARSAREFSRHDLHELCVRKGRAGRFSEILARHEEVALTLETRVVVLTSVSVAALGCSGYDWLRESGAVGRLLLVLLIGLVIGLASAPLRTWIPWSVSRLGAASFLFHTWWMWRVLDTAASPLRSIAHLIDALLHRAAGKTPTSLNEETLEEEIRTIVNEGHREGLLEEDAREMIEGVMELADADVAEIMTPRTDMHMIHVDMTWDEMLTDITEFGHTRVPAYGESRDDIFGVVYVKDLLPELAKGPGEPRSTIRELARKAVFVPQTKKVNDLLEMFQQMRTHIAIVLDEYGGVSGLVTIEDALEEIVGEIVDEYDEDVEVEILTLGPGVCEAVGRAHVDEINQAMGLELPEGQDYDTIAGFVFSEFGRLPTSGESLVWQGSVRLTVLEARRRRIERVRLERVDENHAEGAPRESA
ncbi:Magnesium and cobalt efflux protein CorC [Pseudobythopirellula maris]|uniref:Magnesium and cobalt efflux protein CorC n=1 Tax=Pseudobythopirellula maris TaxID=2527991 RepID=A0A5C5ZMH2_9BACT|nr:hemolysin family protein [Pseudobythopirellula maris]TWT88360.1 Magnesium and cobalt efflux protein CorC [Pseudobythopirellula maris]